MAPNHGTTRQTTKRTTVLVSTKHEALYSQAIDIPELYSTHIENPAHKLTVHEPVEKSVQQLE